MSNDAFEDKFGAVMDYFNTVKKISRNERLKINHEKGINIHVLATVGTMLIYGIGSKKEKNRLDINLLASTDDLDDLIMRTDYEDFRPYIKYLREEPDKKNKKAEKPKKADEPRVYAEYVSMFVRYIYLLKEIGFELVSKD
jgi:hypothetical protein